MLDPSTGSGRTANVKKRETHYTGNYDEEAGRWRGRLAEEAGVSGLLEMMVNGKDLAEALFFHDDKAGAVRSLVDGGDRFY
jgi:hypothetical protein